MLNQLSIIKASRYFLLNNSIPSIVFNTMAVNPLQSQSTSSTTIEQVTDNDEQYSLSAGTTTISISPTEIEKGE